MNCSNDCIKIHDNFGPPPLSGVVSRNYRMNAGKKTLGYGRKSRISHKKCNILLNERKVTNLEIFQQSSYCVHFKYIKVYIFVRLYYRGTKYANNIDVIQGVRKLYRV